MSPLPTYSVEESSALPAAGQRLLQTTAWGIHPPIFTLPHYGRFLATLSNTRYFRLTVKRRFAGIAFAHLKSIRLNGSLAPAAYLGGLAIQPNFRHQGWSHKLLDEIHARLSPSLTLYTHVEAEPGPARRVFEAHGYHAKARFYSMSFTRPAPRRSARIRRLHAQELPMIKRRLAANAKGHSLFDAAAFVQSHFYWVLKTKGGITAGAQIIPWTMNFGGRRIPFLKAGYIYCRRGREEDLFELLEGILAAAGKRLISSYMDVRSSMYSQLTRPGGFARVHPDTAMDVLIRGSKTTRSLSPIWLSLDDD